MSQANAAQKRRLDALLRIPENKVCFECLENQPRWASTNLGVFLCLRCAGLHRSAGTHVSKVRSATMDTWEEDMIRRCERIGNARGRLLYEYNMPDSARPNASTNGAVAERLIREKYEHKRYFNVQYEALLRSFMSEAPPPASESSKDEKYSAETPMQRSGVQPSFPSPLLENPSNGARAAPGAASSKPNQSGSGISIDDLFGSSASAPQWAPLRMGTSPAQSGQGHPPQGLGASPPPLGPDGFGTPVPVHSQSPAAGAKGGRLCPFLPPPLCRDPRPCTAHGVPQVPVADFS
uniref:Uncharacterized protein TCIL3000_11_9540 n=1 Tax=Trypanosoma congolense (strain IL3000) TaxID=1068625 RepID=G0V1G8_TRYCI|nr:unnamed protein product [Trypanosoma congolense IL3000]